MSTMMASLLAMIAAIGAGCSKEEAAEPAAAGTNVAAKTENWEPETAEQLPEGHSADDGHDHSSHEGHNH